MSFFSSRRMPDLRFAITQPQKSVLTRQHIYTIDSGISYTGSIGWRITDPSIRSNTGNEARGTHRSGIQKAWI